MGFFLFTCVGLLLVTATPLGAQETLTARDSARVLLLEHRFGPDSAGSIVVSLERRVVYWAELTGPGTLVLQSVRPRLRPAFLVPIAEAVGDQPRRFEVYARQGGQHLVSLSDLPPGTSATLRLYRDVLETVRIAEKRDREFTMGLSVAGGFHTGYRFDPTGGANPDGGSDLEGCILLEAGSRFGTCLGGGRQAFPDAGFSATWLFLEGRVRLVTRHVLGNRRADLGATLRYSQALNAGPRHLSPGLLGIGLQVTQHLATGGRRRGSRAFFAWQHGRLGNAPETELLDTDRFSVGFIWMP